MNKIFALLILITFTIKIFPQYYIDPTPVYLADTSITTATFDMPVPFNKEDVKAIGMGKTQVANGKGLNGMMYNPALLSQQKTFIEAASFQVSMPPESYDAVNYVQDHREEFKEAFSLKQMWQGVNDFKVAQTLQDQLNAVRKIQEGLQFPRDLLENVIGSAEKPKIHGVKAIPSISAQYKNFGFSLYGIGQSGFQVQQSPLIDALLDIYIPEDLNNNQQVLTAIAEIQALLQTVIDQNNDVTSEALPVTLSLSYIDIVAAAGYGYQVTPQLSFGGNLKVINRRFSAKRIVTTDFNGILNVLKKDLNSNQTGFTLDLGALYEFGNGIQAGVSLQNIIPVQEITSTLESTFTVSYYDYARDQNGQIILTQQGDTVIQSISRNVNTSSPFHLQVPFIINIGAIYPIFPEWDVALDWVDIAEQDGRFDKYFERIRIGTEYRLDAIPGSVNTAFRIGMADGRFTGGLGINLFNVVNIDGAYAWDNFVEAYSYFLQLRLGWY